MYRAVAHQATGLAKRKEDVDVLFTRTVVRDLQMIHEHFETTVRVFDKFYVRSKLRLQMHEEGADGLVTLQQLTWNENYVEDALRMFGTRRMKPNVMLLASFDEDALDVGARSMSPQLYWFLQQERQVMVITGGDHSERIEAALEDSLGPELPAAMDRLGKALLKFVSTITPDR